MRRSFLGPIAAAALLLTALPGAAQARPLDPVPGVFDQGVAASLDGDGIAQTNLNSGHLTQAITPARTGLLTHIDLNCAGDNTTVLTLTVGAVTAHNVCGGGFYQRFIFAPPPSVASGTPYTLGIDTGGASVSLAYTTDPYAGGAAADNGAPIMTGGETPVTIASFSFMTYVAEPPATSYTWNPTSVVAGQSTTATLTAVTSFPVALQPEVITAGVQPSGFLAALPFTLKLAALPAWFTPTGIVCDEAVTNCSIDNFTAGLTGAATGLTAFTVTVSVTGTAAPPAGATDASGQTSGQGCNTWTVDANTTASACGSGQSVLGLVGQPTPPPAATLPPTTTSGHTGGGEPSPWQPLWVLPALLAVATALIRRGVRDLR